MNDHAADVVNRSRIALERALSDPSERRVTAAEVVRQLRDWIDAAHQGGITYRRVAEIVAGSYPGVLPEQIERAITRANRARGTDGRAERYACRPADGQPPVVVPLPPRPSLPSSAASTGEIDDDAPTTRRRLEHYA